MAICFSPIKKSVRSFLSTWRLWTAYITTRKLTDCVSVSLSIVILIGNCPDFHVQRKAKTLYIMLLYSLYSILFLTFIVVFVIVFFICFVLQRYYFSSILSFSFLRKCTYTSFTLLINCCSVGRYSLYSEARMVLLSSDRVVRTRVSFLLRSIQLRTQCGRNWKCATEKAFLFY